jgi:hypothetical protein
MTTSTPAPAYRRDAFTWTAFGALFAFGYLNAVLGPSLPYLRSVEHISYLVGALHQVAFSIGAGVAGALSARGPDRAGRRIAIAGGLVGGGLAGRLRRRAGDHDRGRAGDGVAGGDGADPRMGRARRRARTAARGCDDRR